MPNKDQSKKREELLEKAKFLKDKNLIDDQTYELLTAGRNSLSRLIELSNTAKLKENHISSVAKRLEAFSGVKWDELDNKLETEPLTDVLEEYVEDCLEKLDDKLDWLEEKELEPLGKWKPVRDIPRLDPKMTMKEKERTKNRMVVLKGQVFEDYKKQLQNKEGHERVKHVLNYAVFNMVEGLGFVPEYNLMQDFLTPIGADGEVDLVEGRKRIRETMAFLHEEINKPFIKYARENPNHSDKWYQEHFIAETDAGKYWRILESSLNDAVLSDIYNTVNASFMPAYGLGQMGERNGDGKGKGGLLEIIEEEKAEYLKGLNNEEELQYNAFATRTLKPVKTEVLGTMDDPRTRRIYKSQQKIFKAQEALENNKVNDIQTKKWMEFAAGLDTSFISDKKLKDDFLRMASKDTKDFQDMLVEAGIEDQNTDDLESDRNKKEKLDKPVVLNLEDVVVFSGKNTADILKLYEEVKDVKIAEFNGYAADKDAVKLEDEKKLDAFVENLLDLKADSKLEREADNQKLYDNVVGELKKEQNATALHEYLRKRTLESLAGADGKLVAVESERDLNDNFYDPAINKAIEYYNLYTDITGSDLREKYREDTKKHFNDKSKDAMNVLARGLTITPFAKTLQALRKAKTGKNDPIKKDLLDKNQTLFKSSLLAPYVEGTKMIDNKIAKRNNKLNEKIKQQEDAIKDAKVTVDMVTNNLYLASQNLKLAFDNLKDTSSSNDSQMYTNMVNAIESLRPNKYSNFYEAIRSTDPEELSAKIKDVTQKIEEYITHAESKKWYRMLPGSTGSTRYQEALEAKKILGRISGHRKQLGTATENLDNLEKEEKKLKKEKENGKRMALSKDEIDQMLKPKAKEMPVKSRTAKMLKQIEKSKANPSL